MKLIRGATELPKHLPCSTDDWPELSELSFDSNNPFGMMELSLYSEILAPSMNETDQSFDCLSQLESPIQTQAHPPSTSSSSLYNSKAAPPTIGRRLIFKPNYNGLPKPASEGTREVREELDLFPNPPLSIRCEALEKIVQML
ncbi:uncharacterized protein LOC115628692 [Scaptodrosophila lebanonensis]|uniref:Uncharacterized protein LOC115628692 n=1 Tax=Drosophila lebanonensis TaxID=7225 RepID=A0A6J2TX76_DROLE|nr:uncharacterized protein LOC115628692 [Scaptodrosophila lebanonensis]